MEVHVRPLPSATITELVRAPSVFVTPVMVDRSVILRSAVMCQKATLMYAVVRRGVIVRILVLVLVMMETAARSVPHSHAEPMAMEKCATIVEVVSMQLCVAVIRHTRKLTALVQPSANTRQTFPAPTRMWPRTR